MKIIGFITRLFYSAFVMGFLLCSFATADEPEPVQIGSSCLDIDAIYHLTTDIEKTSWKLNELYAVPVGTVNPESWEQSTSFKASFSSALQNEEGAQAYAETCSGVWQEYFTDDADVIVNLSRSITAIDQILQCVSGNWVLVSTEYLEFQDVSDWLTVNGSPFEVANQSSGSQLQSSLQSLIDSLNSQPGATSDSE